MFQAEDPGGSVMTDNASPSDEDQANDFGHPEDANTENPEKKPHR